MVAIWSLGQEEDKFDKAGLIIGMRHRSSGYGTQQIYTQIGEEKVRVLVFGGTSPFSLKGSKKEEPLVLSVVNEEKEKQGIHFVSIKDNSNEERKKPVWQIVKQKKNYHKGKGRRG